MCAPNPPSAGRSATYTPPTWTGAVKAERERAGGRRRATRLAAAAAAARLLYTLHLVSQARSDGGFKRVRRLPLFHRHWLLLLAGYEIAA